MGPSGGACITCSTPIAKGHLAPLRPGTVNRVVVPHFFSWRAARLNLAEAVASTGYELTVIASVVIGGTSLFGGLGSIFGTVIVRS